MKNLVVITELSDWRLPDHEFMKYFKLPRGEDRCTELSSKNPISSREARIVFEASTHTYKIDGICAPQSVTGLVHSYSGNTFNAEEAVIAMKASRNWEEKRGNFLNEDGNEMTDSAIIDMWKQRGKAACMRGILFHYHCEAHCNGLLIERPHSPEFKMFLELMNVLDQMGYIPFRTEVRLFHIGLCIVCQLGVLFRSHANNTFALIDWKRCRSVVFENNLRCRWPPFDNLLGSN